MSETCDHGEDEYCTDCGWLKTRVDFDSGSNFSCEKDRLGPGAPIVWRRPCRDFVKR